MGAQGAGRRGAALSTGRRRGEEENPHLARARKMCAHLGEIAREAREIQEVIEHVLDNHSEEGFVYPDNPMKRVSNIRESLASIDALAKQALRPGPPDSRRDGREGRTGRAGRKG